MDSDSTRLPLPKSWPQSVRTAIVHVISLARVAIMHTRGLALNSPDIRTRREGDLQGALDEIALLDEELRIKDGRMAMIDPHRRPHYRPIDRMAILELKAARGWSQAETARRFLVKPTTIASWLKRIDEPGGSATCTGARTRQQVPGLGRLRGSQAQGALPFHGSKANCPDVVTSWAPFECEYSRSYVETPRSNAGTPRGG